MNPGDPVVIGLNQALVEPTDKVVASTRPMAMRVWRGVTAEGLSVSLYVAVVAVPAGQAVPAVVTSLRGKRIVDVDRPPPGAN
jgi:hypothetical protein